MFNTNEMAHRRDEYINHRSHLAENDNLARLANSQQPAFGQRTRMVVVKLWQQRPRFISRKALADQATPATLTANALHDAR